MKKKNLSALFSLLPLLAGLSCQRCQPAAVTPLQSIPADVAGAVLIEPAGALVKALQGALTLAGPSAEQGADLNAIKAELGFDPTTLDGLRSAGIDPARPVALAALAAEGGRGELIAVLPCSDPKALEQTARRLAERFGRADKVVEESVANRRALRFARSFGDREIVLGGLVLDPARQLAFVDLGGGGPRVLERALQTTAESSLERAPAFVAGRAKVKPGPLLVWIGAPLLDKATAGFATKTPLSKYAVASAGLDAGGLWIGALLGLEPAARERVQQRLTLGDLPPDIFTLAGRDALLAASGTANVPALLTAYGPGAPPPGGDAAPNDRQLAQAQQLARAVGIDLDRAIVERLRGGVAAALYLDPKGPLLVRRGNPQQLLRGLLGRTLLLHVVADVTPAGSADLLPLIDQYFSKNNVVVGNRTVGNTEAHFAGVGAADERVEWHYALHDGRLLFGLGSAASFDQLLTRAKGAGSGPLVETLSPAIKRDLVGQSGAALYLGFAALTAQLQQLAQAPALADPTLRSGLGKATELTGKLGALALRTHVDNDGLRCDLRLEPAAAEKRAP